MNEPVFWIVAGIVGIIIIVRLFFWLLLFPAWWKTGKKKQKHRDLPPLSVIIAARNEAGNLSRHLPAILDQDYPEFEVIVVDDCSDDNTRKVLQEMAEDHAKLYITWVPVSGKFRRGKKVAVSIGIRAANHAHLVFTDADCFPAGKYWLKEMATAFEPDNKIVLGYGSYKREKGLLNAMVRYDTLLIAMMYGGMACRLKPYMGVGRNLAYKKSLWLERGGFRGFNNVLSGDDDLFVNACATRRNTNVIFSHEAKTISEPPQNFREWKRQKTRHMSSSKYYPLWQRILLVAEPFSRVLTPFGLAGFYWLFLQPQHLIYVILTWALIKILQYVVLLKSQQYTGENNLLVFYPLIDFFLPIIYVIFVTAGLKRRNENVWK